MQLELANYDRSATFNDLQRTIFTATEKYMNAVAIPPSFAPEALKTNPNLVIISPIDYPFGMDCTNVRLESINQAIKRGSKIVELMINSSFIADKRYKQITEDVSRCIILAKAKDVELRVMVEYRLFSSEELIELCRKMYSAGVRIVTIGTGTMVDDPLENLILAKEISKTTKIKTVANSCFYSQEHIDIAQKANIYCIRFNSTIVVEKIFKDSKNGV